LADAPTARYQKYSCSRTPDKRQNLKRLSKCAIVLGAGLLGVTSAYYLRNKVTK
jgi:hypothetical protein